MSDQADRIIVQRKKSKGSSLVDLSVGSGIAISAIWLFATVLTIFAALLFFSDVFTDNSSAMQELKNEGDDSNLLFVYLLFMFIAALPGFAAYWLTKMIIGKDD